MYNISLIPFLFAVIPSILIVRYFYLQDINKPEPIHLIVKVFFMGILCTIPVIILEMIVSEMIKPLSYNVAIFSFAQAFIVAGLCEESMKLMTVCPRKICFKTKTLKIFNGCFLWLLSLFVCLLLA